MSTIIRADLSNAGHAEALLSLLDEYARTPAGGSEPLAPYTRDNLIAALRERPTVHVLFAVSHGEEIGMAICVEGFSTFACKPLLNIHDLVVTASMRGRGIGRALIEAAAAFARERGCCKLTLEVLDGNRGAQSLYRSCGFAPYALDPAMGNAQFWQRSL